MKQSNDISPIVQVGNVLISSDILTEEFCCNLDECKGICCVEGDSGAPATLDETLQIENVLDEVWHELSASAQSIIDKQGIAYTDNDGDLSISIVKGKDCVFTCYENNKCLCVLERIFQQGHSVYCKPISCALYPIREKLFSGGIIGLNYHRWEVCKPAVKKGKELELKIYQFLKEPLIRRFGKGWYNELCEVAEILL